MPFYPTYEEWKLPSLSPTSDIIFSAFYPTYEEWKLAERQSELIAEEAFYPTYEEWKLALDACTVPSA